MDTNFLGLSHLLYPFSGGEQMKLPHNWAKVWFDPFDEADEAETLQRSVAIAADGEAGGTDDEQN